MKEPEVILNPDLQKALRGFVPSFGNEEDLRIMRDLEKLHLKLRTIDCNFFREAQRRKAARELTSKMRDIQREEEYLIRRIIQRNLDF